MIKLRLRRMGAKKRPSYRIVAADSRSPRDGRFIESVGIYDPITDPATIRLDEDRVRHWLGVGAQPTETVAAIFRRHNLLGNATADSATEPPAVETPDVPEEAAPAPTRRRRAPAASTTTEPAPAS